MAIQSASEFEAIISRLLSRVEKALVERGSVPILETVIRDLKDVQGAARVGSKLKSLRGVLGKATDILCEQIPDDNEMRELLWDLDDYIVYRA